MRRIQTSFFVLALAIAAFGQNSGPFIGGAWSGNVSPTGATVSIRLNTSGQRVRLQVSRQETLSPGLFSSAATTAANLGNTVKLTVQGLEPDTDYYYGVEVAGVLRAETIS